MLGEHMSCNATYWVEESLPTTEEGQFVDRLHYGSAIGLSPGSDSS
jgi:hypothetical protein